MKLDTAITLNHLPPRQLKPFVVMDMHYGHVVSDWDTKEEADRAAAMRPYSKVVNADKVTGPAIYDVRKIQP